MASLEELEDLERDEQDKKDDKDEDKDKSNDTDMKDAEEEELLDEEILSLSTRDIVARRRLLENELRIMKSEFQRLTHEKGTMNEKIKDNMDKIENNK